MSASIENVGGIYKCSVTGTIAAITDVVPQLRISNSSGTRDITGDGVAGVFAWGAHLYSSDLGGMQDNPDNTIAGLESYVPTTTAAVYKRRNNYVYNGASWIGPKCLVEPAAATNLLLNSETLSTQNVTVAAVANTLHFTGTGTVTLTGVSTDGPLVGTGTGEENRVSLTFTPTAGTLTLTVSGTVTSAQLELGEVPSSYIPTAGSTETRDAETHKLVAANLASVVNTTAMSMQLGGLMSYADENAAAQTVLARWRADANNSIIIDMDTDGAATGEINFNQTAAGTLDTVASAADAYAPNINVAFNIASRHTSGAINGAVDGTALTEDATPIALADLSSADLEIAETGIHNIELLRIWGVDITDAGIAEASA